MFGKHLNNFVRQAVSAARVRADERYGQERRQGRSSELDNNRRDTERRDINYTYDTPII